MPVSNWKPGGFSAANGTAEASAAGRYTGKISLMTLETPFPKPQLPPWNGTTCPPSKSTPPDCVPRPQWNHVSPGPNGTLHGFSAVCWYTGKALFERLAGRVPVGLIVGSVGGSPIEFWLPPESLGRCTPDMPACDTKNNHTDSGFFKQYIQPFQPYTIGSLVWDQGERDVHCFAPATNRTAAYPCMERELVRSWRQGFNSSFAFVAVQLPGYIGDCDAIGANPASSYRNCVPGVFDMRLAQDAGTVGDAKSGVVATYDLSCPFGVAPPQCPFGSVHNLYKTEICDRVARQLLRMRGLSNGATEGPRAVAARSSKGHVEGTYTVTVTFTGGTLPLYQKGTQFCAKCCAAVSESGDVGDFDVSGDGGLSYTNATVATVHGDTVAFKVEGLAGPPTHVRYTANQGFPQCAVYNQEGLPALPFTLACSSGGSGSGGRQDEQQRH